MCTVLEGLAEAVSVGFEDSLETSTAGSFGLGRGTVVGDKGEAVGHVKDEAGAVHSRRWSVVSGGDSGEI